MKDGKGGYDFYGPSGERAISIDRWTGIWSYEGSTWKDGTFYHYSQLQHGWPKGNEERIWQLFRWLLHEDSRPKGYKDNPGIPRLRQSFRKLLWIAQEAFPGFEATLFVAPASMFREARARAYTTDDDPPRIGVSEVLEQENNERQVGVLSHEFGHALLFFLGLDRHTEREADKMAERLFRSKIYYDRDLLIQTIEQGHGIRPRPSWLG